MVKPSGLRKQMSGKCLGYNFLPLILILEGALFHFRRSFTNRIPFVHSLSTPVSFHRERGSGFLPDELEEFLNAYLCPFLFHFNLGSTAPPKVSMDGFDLQGMVCYKPVKIRQWAFLDVISVSRGRPSNIFKWYIYKILFS